jgi:hypothetical protein
MRPNGISMNWQAPCHPIVHIAPFIVAPQNVLMAVDDLDAFLFGIAVNGAGSKDVSFEDRVSIIADRSAGAVICNVRLDGDPQYQRIAVVRLPSNDIGIIALGKDGLSVGSCTSNGAFSSFLEPLAEWHRLPLKDQAIIDVRGHATLFAAALRSAGYLTPR